MARPRRQSGFTFLEVTIGIAIFTTVVTILGQTLAAGSGLSARSRVELRAAEESRRNLESIADLLRAGSLATITGVDEDGNATNLGLQRVTGATAGTPSLGSAELISWHPRSQQVAGISSPGEVVAVKDGQLRTLAARVPYGGLTIKQQGRTVLVTLTTYYATSQGLTRTRTDQISVTLRN